MKREKRIRVCEERTLYADETYFFSPHFKRSDEVIEGVTRGYMTKEHILENFFKTKKFFVRQDFDKKKNLAKDIKKLLTELRKEGNEISFKDILAIYKAREFTLLFSSDRILSDYRRDDTHEMLVCLIKDADLLKKGTIKDNQRNFPYEDWGEFPDEMIKFSRELKELNSTVDIKSGKHPLNKEKRKVRENYLNILVNIALFDGGLSSNEIVRIEILSRLLGIDSMSTLKMIKNGMELHDSNKEDKEGYISKTLEYLNEISKTYYYMLYHDAISFELLEKRGEVTEKEQQNVFSERLARECAIRADFREKYGASVQKLIVCSYELRHILADDLADSGGDEKVYESLADIIEYEYDLQRELLR